MIHIDAVWLALGASDLRGGIDALLRRVVRGFAWGAQPHHAYVFANRRADRLKVLGRIEAVELATLEWVSWFNHHRLLEPIGSVPLAEAEADYYRQLTGQTMLA